MAHLRHPLIGDARHGDGKQNRFAREMTGHRRLMLVAVKLEWQDLDTGEHLSISVQPDDQFKDIQSCLGF